MTSKGFLMTRSLLPEYKTEVRTKFPSDFLLPEKMWILVLLAKLLFMVSGVHSAIVPGTYIFGASMLDAGTNQYINSTNNGGNFPPYGQTFFHRPTGRFSNGLILSDFLEIRVGIDIFLSPYLQPNASFEEGANFASAGSGILDSTNQGKVVPLGVQTEQFLQLVRSKNKTELARSLVVVNSGTNDLMTHFGPLPPSNATLSPEQVIPTMTTKFERFLKVLRGAGIRKVVIVGISPLGYQPAFRPWPGVENLNLQVRKFNQELMKIVVNSRTEQHHEEKPELVYFNAYDLFIDMINNKNAYVLSETKANCYNVGDIKNLCKDPSRYLYWDGHPTQQGYFYMADAIWSGDASLMWPVNMKTLLSER